MSQVNLSRIKENREAVVIKFVDGQRHILSTLAQFAKCYFNAERLLAKGKTND